MAAKKNNVSEEKVLLIRNNAKHIMRMDLFEKDKDAILKAGYKIATEEQYMKHFNIKFENIEKETKKPSKPKVQIIEQELQENEEL